jgi:hypothetical protein
VINHLNEPPPAAMAAARWAETQIIGAALDIPPRLPSVQAEVESAAVEQLFDQVNDEAQSKRRLLPQLDRDATDERPLESDWLAAQPVLDDSLLDLLAADDDRLEAEWV